MSSGGDIKWPGWGLRRAREKGESFSSPHGWFSCTSTNMGEARGTDFSCSVCRVCAETFVGAGQCCSRACRVLLAELEEFWTLHSILVTARWAGAPTVEEYLRSRMWEAVRVLPHSEERLA